MRTTAIKKAAGPESRAALGTTHKFHHSPTDNLLSLLEGVKRTGTGIWLARCPAHQDRSPSLSIREAAEGKTLIHCHAGCSAHEVVSAVGLELTDLFPPRPADPAYIGKPERRPFPAADCLRAVAFEGTIIALAAVAIIAGDTITQFDKDRLLIAVGRINAALDAGGLNHG